MTDAGATVAEIIAALEEPQEAHHLAQRLELWWEDAIKPALLSWEKATRPPGASAMEITKRFVRAYVRAPARKNFEDGEDNALISFAAGFFEQAERETRAAAIQVLMVRSDQWGDKHNEKDPCSLTVRNELAAAMDGIRPADRSCEP